jgi:hypothetical protein
MEAYRSVRDEMRATCRTITQPNAARIEPTARITRGGSPEGDKSETHIEPWMEVAFEALTHASETGEPFALISCLNNGKPAALIAATRREGRRTHVLPLFVAVDDTMRFSAQPDDGDTS